MVWLMSLRAEGFVPAAKSPLFLRAFMPAVKAQLVQRFGALRLYGVGQARAALRRGPVLFVSNHPSFWDAMVLLELCRLLPMDCYAWMDGANLRRFAFLAWAGAFGVHQGKVAALRAALRFAEAALCRPGRCVWMFPEGAVRPSRGAAAPCFRRGSTTLARLAPQATVVPVAFSYLFEDAPAPVVHVAFGAPLAPGDAPQAGSHAAAVGAVVQQLEATAHAWPPQPPEQSLVWQPPRPLAWPTRLLAAVARLLGPRLIGEGQ